MSRWLKGNTHTHTTESDGDSPLEAVAGWYEDHGYDFLVITDHNRVTDVSGYSGRLTLLAGNEISLSAEGKPVHVCGLHTPDLPTPQPGETIVETLQIATDAILAAGGVAQANHPNWHWAFGAKELTQVKGCALLEIFNANWDTNNFGGGGSPSTDEMWDEALTAGLRIWGVASDDMHHLTGDPADRRRYWPGFGWVCVEAAANEPAEIARALAEGRFYASTEVELLDYAVDADEIRLEIAPIADFKYDTCFIGSSGRTLAVVPGLSPAYRMRGDEGYVRARVASSNHGFAWTQPVFLG